MGHLAGLEKGIGGAVDLGDLAGVTWYGPASEWPSNPDNAPWIQFWRDVDREIGAGAYGFVMSSNYNTRPRAAEVMVRGERYAVVRRREELADLIRGESVPAWAG